MCTVTMRLTDGSICFVEHIYVVYSPRGNPETVFKMSLCENILTFATPPEAQQHHRGKREADAHHRKKNVCKRVVKRFRTPGFYTADEKETTAWPQCKHNNSSRLYD